jgi:membrane associated rhomboid family serine protease
MTNPLRKPFKYRYYNVTFGLIMVNAVVFGLQKMFPNLTYYLAMCPLVVAHGWVWQFFTYMFAHASITHILFNMLALFVFGVTVERSMGSTEFLVYYLVSGFLAGVVSFVIFMLTGTMLTFLLGASGAIFAVQLAYAVVAPNERLYIWGIIPMRASVMVLVFTGIEVLLTMFGANSGVAHLTHLAGFAVGWLYIVVRFRVNPWKRLTNKG